MHPFDAVNKVLSTSRQMVHEIGRKPTLEELAARLGMRPEEVRKVLKITEEPILIPGVRH